MFSVDSLSVPEEKMSFAILRLNGPYISQWRVKKQTFSQFNTGFTGPAKKGIRASGQARNGLKFADRRDNLPQA
jgi:hypothetical protein